MNPDRLHDIIEPQAVSWLPQTVGWAVLAVVVFAVLARWSWSRYRAWQRAAYRRDALAELAKLQQTVMTDGDRAARTRALAALPELVKRVALSATDRAAVAGLSGEAWLSYLDRSYARPAFTEGLGRRLPELTYAPPDRIHGLVGPELESLFALVEDWIRTHRPPDPAAGADREA
jgi:hypothetical protein